MTPKPLKVVLDTNFFVQYFLNPTGSSAACLRALESRSANLFVSKDLLAEIATVLIRPKITARAPHTSPDAVEVFMRFLAEIAILEDPIPHTFDFERDRKDEIIIDLAIEARADVIVTRDKDLLDLMVGYSETCKEFRRRFRFLKVIEPSALLALLAEADEPEGERK